MYSTCSYKQTTDYSCGAAALRYFLHITDKGEYQEMDLAAELHTSPANGTNPIEIEFWLKDNNIACIAGLLEFHEVKLPMIVNYWNVDDGHYVVITSMGFNVRGATIVYFDPADGEIKSMRWEDFVHNWYSKRYGTYWGLCLG